MTPRDRLTPHQARRFNLGVCGAGLGILLLASPDKRLSAPAFAAAAATPGGLAVWGLAFLFLGVGLIVVARLTHPATALLALGAGIYAFWALAQLIAALQNPEAAITGVWIYGFLGYVHALAAIDIERA